MTAPEPAPSSTAPARRVPWSGWALFALSLVLESCGQLFLKLGARSVPAGLSDLETIGEAATSLWAYCGYGCIAVQFPVWLGVLARMELSLAFPLSSLAQVTILLGSIFVLGEAASVSQVAGISSIILGTFLIVGDDGSREGTGECQEAHPEPPGTSEACERLEP